MFISLNPDFNSIRGINKIRQMIVELGLQGELLVKPSELHCTLMYDRRNPAIFEYSPSRDHYFCKITGVALMGKPKSEWEAISVTLEPDVELKARFEELCNIGFVHSHKEFKPNISLVYHPTGNRDELLSAIEELNYRVKCLPLIDSTISLYNEQAKKTSEG